MCYFIFPLIFCLFDDENKRVNYLSIISISSFLLAVNIGLKVGTPNFYKKIEIMTTRFSPFCLGVFIANEARCNAKIPFGAYIFAFLCLFLPIMNSSVFNRYSRGLCTIACLFFVMLMLEILEIFIPVVQKVIVRVFSLIGKFTLELYLTHVAIRRCLQGGVCIFANFLTF